MPLRAQAGEDLPDPLPDRRTSRASPLMTAAQMRKMMEGVVLYGTGKAAQLNGYSSGGKTGTAQKVDPATHLYSKTMHVASFAGIAPVNNPVIAVAVVMDNPKGASYYGAAVSAPVFAEVAQQVLEYLNVPHDIDVRQPKTSSEARAARARRRRRRRLRPTSTRSSPRSTISPPTIRLRQPVNQPQVVAQAATPPLTPDNPAKPGAESASAAAIPADPAPIRASAEHHRGTSPSATARNSACHRWLDCPYAR